MSATEVRCAQYLADGGVCSLFVDDELPADRRSLELFLESDLQGVVIPTVGFPAARLVCGEDVIRGNQQIGAFIVALEQDGKAPQLK